MTPGLALVALAVLASGGHARNAGTLPVCSNRIINRTVERAGCTLGDARCWIRGRGFCADWVHDMVGKERAARAAPIPPENVRKGDVAVFASRAHYALVEAVTRDASGRAVAVDVTEYNFGTCWVDPESMVTEKYRVVNRRSGVPLGDVDGGFLRPGAESRAR